MRPVRKLVALALALVAAAVLFVAATGEDKYLRRIATYTDRPITDVHWYDGRVAVPGAHRPLATGTTAISKQALDAAVAYARATNTAALVVAHRSKIVLEHYDPVHGPSVTTNAMSMTKTLLAILVGIAIDDGAIESVDDPAAKYLPEWSGGRASITIRHLLEMTSGLDNDNTKGDPFSDLARMHLGPHIEPLVLGLEAVEPPGQRYEYNNFNSQILGVLVERAMKRRFGELLGERILRPIGAADGEVWPDDDGLARTYCCVFLNARDWARVGIMLLDGGTYEGRRVVSKAWVDAMRTPSRIEPEYGLHVWLAAPDGDRRFTDRTEPFDDPAMFYLDGKDRQRVYVLPSAELVIVRTGEQPDRWDDAKLPNTLLRGLVRAHDSVMKTP